MKKRFNPSKSIIYSFMVAGILIGVLVAAQFQSSVAANTHLADEVAAQNEILESFTRERKSLQAKISNLHQQIEQNRDDLQLVGGESLLIEVLDELKKIVGLTKISGEGLLITLADGENAKMDQDESVIHAADLRDMVNLLRTADIEAISINNQRIVLASTINSVGNNILINKTRSVSPFQIKVIGDTSFLINRLNDQSNYPDLYQRISDKKVLFELEKLPFLTIPLYDGDYLLKYAKKYTNN
ncbi:DUF881 domain-containing protein [Candidatus Peregrinibacteria bacterium]|nr:DUF881 domain-containing protein [Candidatus Peregrinibacteria bacterium]